MTQPLLEVQQLKKYFPVEKGFFGKTNSFVHAVDDISFSINKGDTFGMVGESGCGKSTTGRLLMKLLDPTEGSLWFDGENITNLTNAEKRKYSREVQMIFQDPFASLNPRMKVKDLVMEPLIVHNELNKEKRKKSVSELLELVGLTASQGERYPHEFSGGQRQRVGIARALVLNPNFIIADEPVSALDVSIQSQILNLLQDIRSEFNLTYLFISHDLSVVEHICNKIGVMYLGKLAEVASKEMLFNQPKHPYTEALLSSIPSPDPKDTREKIILQGDIPSPINPPSGCRFHTRCPYSMPICKTEEPKFREISSDQYVACHLY